MAIRDTFGIEMTLGEEVIGHGTRDSYEECSRHTAEDSIALNTLIQGYSRHCCKVRHGQVLIQVQRSLPCRFQGHAYPYLEYANLSFCL